MPSLLDLHLLPSPLVDPLSYPGTTLRHSFLWLDSWVYRMRFDHRMPSDAGTGWSGWGIDSDGGPLPGGVVPLDDALRLAGAAAMSERHPVLAFGSNAAPAQLSTKFAALSPLGRTVPVLRGSVAGLALGHSPHVSIPGYLPYVIVDGGPAAVLDAVVLWLDPEQRTVLGRTEPNYRLVPMPEKRYPLRVAAVDTVGAYSAYKGKWGALCWPDDVAPARAGSQREVFAGLGGQPWFRATLGHGDAASWITRLAADRALRDEVRRGLMANGMVVADGWDEAPPLPP